MNDSRRLYKKTFIALIYAVFWILFFTGIYFWLRPAPAPLIVKPNIVPIEITWVKSFISGLGLYSVGAKIRNPNTGLGASQFNYTFSLYDTNGNLLTNKKGSSFVWPGESKYIIEGGINLSVAPVRVSITFENQQWEEVKNFQGVSLTVRNINMRKLPADQGYYEATGTVFNGTAYDLAKVYISAVIFDQTKAPLAVNPTIIENLKSQEGRSVRLMWFSTFAGTPSSVDFSASTNLWDRPELLQ